MLFFKTKPKNDELLPPPPPPTDADLEKEFDNKNDFFDEIVEEEPSQETFPGEEEFTDAVEKFDKKAVQKRPKPEKEAGKKINKPAAKKQRIAEKAAIKQVKLAKAKGPKIKTVKSQKAGPEPEEKSSYMEEFSFDLPKELSIDEDKIELPDTLEELHANNDLEAGKPDEILEARKEIKSAIDRIKEQEKPSIFRRLFGKKEIPKEPPMKVPIKENILPEPIYVGKASNMQDSINKTRLALMKFDLEDAKNNYVEVMKAYNSLKPEEQAKFYEDIKELYFERKSAEKLKV